ncbi:MAG: hypothetical protein AVDCRST_MAG40-833, partial [uncultured Gemmatimonadaceae bacterium]
PDRRRGGDDGFLGVPERGAGADAVRACDPARLPGREPPRVLPPGGRAERHGGAPVVQDRRRAHGVRWGRRLPRPAAGRARDPALAVARERERGGVPVGGAARGGAPGELPLGGGADRAPRARRRGDGGVPPDGRRAGGGGAGRCRGRPAARADAAGVGGRGAVRRGRLLPRGGRARRRGEGGGGSVRPGGGDSGEV